MPEYYQPVKLTIPCKFKIIINYRFCHHRWLRRLAMTITENAAAAKGHVNDRHCE